MVFINCFVCLVWLTGLLFVGWLVLATWVYFGLLLFGWLVWLVFGCCLFCRVLVVGYCLVYWLFTCVVCFVWFVVDVFVCECLRYLPVGLFVLVVVDWFGCLAFVLSCLVIGTVLVCLLVRLLAFAFVICNLLCVVLFLIMLFCYCFCFGVWVVGVCRCTPHDLFAGLVVILWFGLFILFGFGYCFWW